jgi:hypothetical protein
VVAYSYNPRYSRGEGRRISISRQPQAKLVRLYLKKKRRRRRRRKRRRIMVGVGLSTGLQRH